MALEFYTENQTLKISHWFRCEHLVEDFTEFISNYVNIAKDKIMQKLHNVKVKPKLKYDNLESYWNKDQLKIIYENNPLWAEIENRVYGRLLI